MSERIGYLVMMGVVVLGLIVLFYREAPAPAPASAPPAYVLMSSFGMQEFSSEENCAYAVGFVRGVKEDAIATCIPK